MKKILLVIAAIAVFAFNSVNAQWCGEVNSAIPPQSTQLGFPDPDSVPCAIQGVAYADTMNFQMYSTFTYAGTHSLDSITIDTILGLPCGFCWSLNKANRTYVPNELGALIIKGTTSDPVGQYNIKMKIEAYLTGASSETILPSTVYAAGIRVFVRVAAPSGPCTAVDTSQNRTDQVPSTTCSVGINEVAANLNSVNIMPNPMSSGAELYFVAEKSATYQVKITDVTGKVISVKEILAVSGANTSTIERNNLPAGMYLLTLSDGVSSITRKFSVAD